MEKLNDQIYKKYTALKKQKLLDDELAREREAAIKTLHGAMLAWVKDLEGKNEELRQKMKDMLDEHEKNRENFLDEIRARDNEILRLNLLLAEKTDINNSTAPESLNKTPETLLRKSTPVQSSKTSKSNSKAKRVRLSEAIVPDSSKPLEVAGEFECSKSPTRATGTGTNGSSSAHILHMLLESLLCMKLSVNKETEGFSFSACHEDTGYSFTLTWLEQHNEWSYMVSSLGSLDRVAFDWMNQDIKFHMNMARLFFRKISDTIRKS